MRLEREERVLLLLLLRVKVRVRLRVCLSASSASAGSAQRYGDARSAEAERSRRSVAPLARIRRHDGRMRVRGLMLLRAGAGHREAGHAAQTRRRAHRRRRQHAHVVSPTRDTHLYLYSTIYARPKIET